jgi:Fe-S-cluster containining protein
VTTTRVLSLHAAYGCRERGACCTAGWPIPIEAGALARAERAIAAGSIDVPAPARPAFLRPTGAPAETPALLGTHHDRCVFYTRTGTNRCSLHRALGHAALPLACRQFPRVSVTDPRGVSITLSHYCPTAADLLETAAPLRILEDALGFPVDGEYVGLDVRDALPPALRPDMLMDWDSWWQWESEAVALIASQADPQEAMARLLVAVELARNWSPDGEPLRARVKSAFETAQTTARPAARTHSFDVVAASVLDAVPIDYRGQAEAALARRSSTTHAHAHVAFLGAHAFANWAAHLGDDLRTWWRSIEAAHVLISAGMSVRDVDLLLRHFADPHALASQPSGTRRIPHAR